MEQGKYAFLSGYIGGGIEDYGRWYKSRDKLEGLNPYGGYISNKKWEHIEV